MNTITRAKSTMWEKAIYGIGNVGANLCWTFTAMYITMYYTDTVGLAAAVVGTVMLAARLLDGVTDVICAILIEKVHFKLGKVRPWFMICAPLLGIGLWLSFHVPQDGTAQFKAVYVFLTYTFTAAVAFTLYNLAYSSILSLMSTDSNDRDKAATVGGIITMVGVLIMNVATPILLALWGGEKSQASWGTLSTAYSIICVVAVFAMGVFIKEKKPDVEQAPVEKVGTRRTSELLKIVLSSKYTWFLLVVFFCSYINSGIGGIGIYYVRDILGNLELQSLISLVTTGAMIVTMFFVPAVIKKFGRNRVCITGLIVFAIAKLSMFLVGSNVIGAITVGVISTIGLAPITTVIFTYVADLVDYFYAKKGVRVEGLASMASSVGTKIGTGLGSAAVGWGLAIFQYDSTAMIQSSTAKIGILVVNGLVPAIVAAVMILMLKKWDISPTSKES